jgi:hypothetical protein
MNYATALQEDFELRDDLQLVTLEKAATGESIEDVLARFRDLNQREASFGGDLNLESTDQVIELSAKSFFDAVPERGDKVITADETKWIIVGVFVNAFSGTPVTYNATVREAV